MSDATALDYGFFSFASKDEVLEKSKEYWNPGKTQFWIDSGVPLVIDRREGYFLYDMSGRRLIDLHLNGGTYNFGHRHPELVETLKGALDYFDIGNHWKYGQPREWLRAPCYRHRASARRANRNAWGPIGSSSPPPIRAR